MLRCWRTWKGLSGGTGTLSSKPVLVLFMGEGRLWGWYSINKHYVEWRCRFGQLEQRVALYRAWDVLPESLQRSVANPPELLNTVKQIALEEQDVILVDAWKALENYVNGYVTLGCMVLDGC